MKFGTHNSATGGSLLWWLKPFAWVINPTSKCQDRTIQEQLADGVKLFNLQVAYVGGKWRFSHGLALYREDVMLTIRQLRAWATKHEPIYIQLYLDRCFWATNSDTAFAQLVADIKKQFCCPHFVMLSAWIEGTDKYPHKSESKLKWEEHYWTLAWGKMYGKNWLDKLPLPRRHARLHNTEYKKNCKTEYLMLDFYGL